MVINCDYDDSGETYFDVDGDGGNVNCDGVGIDGTETEIYDADDDGDKGNNDDNDETDDGDDDDDDPFCGQHLIALPHVAVHTHGHASQWLRNLHHWKT